MILIVVESPTKAKAIGEYLKGEKQKYTVLSTFGHVRNLEPKSGSIETDNDYKFHWKTSLQWDKQKKTVLEAATEAEKIVVATDLDREGEGIAWHFLEILKQNKIDKPIERIVFHSVSKAAILEALSNSIEIRKGLIESYLARLGLDYLFGFSVSPVLWRKVPCCKSAGRVQSVALRLIVEREDEIRKFKSKDYQTIHAKFMQLDPVATLMELDGEAFENGNIFDKKIDLKIFDLANSKFAVSDTKNTQTKIAAPAPFITSTLLQAASNKLNFSPAMTMQLAQKLYEGFEINGKHVGLITYIRTDSTSIAASAIESIRAKITKKFEPEYLPSKPNIHKSSSKNSQEAHEAIRVVDVDIENPKLGDRNLEGLYKLIWQRTIASQMAACVQETTTVKIDGTHLANKSVFEVKSMQILFLGFKALEFDDEDEKSAKLTAVKSGAIMNCEEIFAKDHQTQPPKRYSEASLIQNLEKRGIGRPSTYPKIISVLYEREYAIKNKKIIAPTQKGWVVTAFLKKFFQNEVAYEFTANLEDELDNLNQSNGNHVQMLDKFWNHLSKTIGEVNEKNPLEISKGVQHEFAEYFLEDKKVCDKCGGSLMLKITRFGAMLGCQNYPDCKNVVNVDSDDQAVASQERIWRFENYTAQLKIGQYGPYLEIKADNLDQKIEESPKKREKKDVSENIKRIAVPKEWPVDEFNEQHAEFLANLPKELGEFEDKKVTLSIGRFGPFIKHGDVFVSVKNILELDLDLAIEAIEQKRVKPVKPRFERKIFSKPAAKNAKSSIKNV